MLGVALVFIGAVLMINGISLTGRIDPKDAAGMNLLVGILAFSLNMAEVLQATKLPEYFAGAGGLFFAFTYLYLAAVQWFGLKGIGLGWYCLFVSVNAVIYALLTHDIRLTAMWLAWASLWFLFFVSLGLQRNVRYLGAYTIAIGVVTAWVPGLLMVTGRW
jgi:hypothetical protein